MEEIIREVNTMEMDVVVLTEIKKKGKGSETLGNYIVLTETKKREQEAKRWEITYTFIAE